jgi:glutathione synthase/RimK-type ligase-like ATP-grasp enzyme
VILLFGIPSETPMVMVAQALGALGQDPVVINQRDVERNRIRLGWDGAHAGGELRTGDLSLDLAEVDGIYLRPMDDRRLPELAGEPTDSPLRRRTVAFHELVIQWTEAIEITVINRYSRMGSNFSKPYQAQLITQSGLATPETLVTNDPQAVLAFREEHGELIFKSISGERSIVKKLGEADLARLDRIRHCPVQFQVWVPGQDIRVHTIGDRCFATAISSTGVDYRYAGQRDGAAAELSATTLPDEIAERCLALTAHLGLEFAGIDLRRDPDGRYVCFEVNPSPAFSYYESHTGQPIAAAVADHLLRDARGTRETARGPALTAGDTARRAALTADPAPA